MTRKKAVVVGSLNMDLVVRTRQFPEGGQTVQGESFQTLHGGKGANQAVACARLGAPVLMIGQVGKDDFGVRLRSALETEKIEVTGVLISEQAPTGIATILVESAPEKSGQNRIILASGANGLLFKTHLENQKATIQNAAILVAQLEIPLETVLYAIILAKEARVPVLLNPAPACLLPESIYAALDFLIPNESEASFLSGMPVNDVESAFAAAQFFRAKGVKTVLITLGARGVILVDENGQQHFPAERVNAVDTTAAGDTFIGGFVAGLLAHKTIPEAILLGQKASALCVQRLGAQASIPFLHEIL